jgi:hypothetical protein
VAPDTVRANFEMLDARIEEIRALRDMLDDREIHLECIAHELAEIGEFYKAHCILEKLIKLGSKYAQGLSKDLDNMQSPWQEI